MLLSLVFGLIIGAVSVVFALQNIFPVTVTFFSWELTTSLAILIAIAIFIGFLVSSLLSIPSVIKDIFVISRLKKENKHLNDELKKIQIIHQETIVLQPVETEVLR